MRWIWIDKFIEFTPKTSATALKNVSLAEEHLHDLYPAFPIVPHSLLVEGMAQTAGILVGEARGFREKVILAKVGRATFHRLVRPGDTILFHAKIDQLNEHGASINGTVTTQALSDGAPAEPVA
jgi:3-hydroxyacyl-[acyl-carrier-protein] dehydratase